MFYNKQFGLELLKRALSGTEGINVLPYIRFERPEEFDPNEFRNSPRILIRSNLDGNLSWEEYSHLPRGEIRCRDPKNVRSFLRSLVGYWHRYLGKRHNYRPIHFLVHSVERRKDVMFEGTFRPAGPHALLEMSRPDPDQVVWGLQGSSLRHDTADGVGRLTTKLVRAGMCRADGVRLASRLHEALRLVMRRIEYEGHSDIAPRWTLSFSIQKTDPSRPIFYRFVFEGGRIPEVVSSPPSRPTREKLLAATAPVVFVRGGIGDYVVSLPAVRALAELFEDRLVLVCAKGPYKFLFDDLPLARCVTPEFQLNEFDVGKAVLRTGHCDLFMSLATWDSESLSSFRQRLSPAWSIGLLNGYRQVVRDHRSPHIADLTFSVVRALVPHKRIEDFAAPPHIPAQSMREANEVLTCFGNRTRVLAVHNESLREKCWPEDQMAEALDRFLTKHKNFVALLVGKSAERQESLEFRDRIYSCHGLALATCFALVSRADLFLGIDSCMLHMADLYRVPAVGIFGPSGAEWWGFRFGPGIAIQGDGVMAAVRVDRVCEALDSRLVR
jgi:ADP-heptose:LPS heptosyltransferase